MIIGEALQRLICRKAKKTTDSTTGTMGSAGGALLLLSKF